MVRGQALADVPITIASVDPCMACTDRVVLIEDVKENTSKLSTLSDLSIEFQAKAK